MVVIMFFLTPHFKLRQYQWEVRKSAYFLTPWNVLCVETYNTWRLFFIHTYLKCIWIEVLLHWVHRYLQLLCLSLGLIPWSWCRVFLTFVIFFILRSILSDKMIATPAFFCFPCACLFVSWGIRWASCRQHI